MIYGIFENTLQHVSYNLWVIVNITDEYMHTERNELKSIHCTMIAILFATEWFKLMFTKIHQSDYFGNH